MNDSLLIEAISKLFTLIGILIVSAVSLLAIFMIAYQGIVSFIQMIKRLIGSLGPSSEPSKYVNDNKPSK